MKKIRISSVWFILIFCTFTLILNLSFFNRAFKVINFNDNFIFALSMPFVFFALLLILFSCFFVPFLTKPIAIFITVVSGFCSYFMYSYGTVMDHEMIRNALQTDPLESKNLMNLNMALWVVCLVILPTLLIWRTQILYFSLKKELLFRLLFVLVASGFVGVVFMTLSKTYIPFFRQNRELRFYTLPFYPTYSAIKLYNKINAAPKGKMRPIAQDAVMATNLPKKLFVLVVGETARSANYSLNGYGGNETNAYLKKQTNLTSFTQFYSCGTATAVSVPCMFSDLKRSGFSVEEAGNRQNLLDVLARVGVDVYWFGNNSGSCKGVCDRVPKNRVKLHNASGFDGVIFDEAKGIIKEANSTTFIVLHLQGSHGPVYFEGYPKEFKKFTPTCDTSKLESCSLKAIQNTYDNTILYTDYLINSLIDSLKSKKGEFEVGMFYLSDHGESLGENGIYLHGMPYSIAPDFQKHIPAILWMNSLSAEQISSLKNIQNQKFSQDNLFSTILGVFEIKTKAYEPKFDILNSIKGEK